MIYKKLVKLMSDNKKYYYMRVQENFYEREEIQILESMENGILYSNILMKLYLKSIKKNGKLMFNDLIPYTPELLAKLLKVEIGTMTFALNLFKQLDLIEILDNGAIFMLNIQEFIGKSSTEADRKRLYRLEIEAEKKKLRSVGQIEDKCPDKTPPENRDKRIENRDKRIEKDIELNSSCDEESSPKKLSIDYKLIIEEWNRLGLSQLSKITSNSQRQKMLKARIREHGQEVFIQAIRNISQSDFLKGKNDRGWTITFDWFIKPNNFQKVLEGNYRTSRANKVQNASNDTDEPYIPY